MAPPSSDIQHRLALGVFLSSLGDVADERGLARQVLTNLPKEPQFQGRVTLDEVSWDTPGAGTPLEAHLPPQEAINQRRRKPSECDIVLVILWSRMGTPLLADISKPDGTAYLSGTEWEYLNAIEATERQGRPQVYVYRRTEKVWLDPDALDFDEATAQRRRVQEFFQTFRAPDGSLRQSFHCYASPSEFAALLEDHLRELIWEQLKQQIRGSLASRASSREAEQSKLLWQGNPYRGLSPFTEDHAPIFFGRGRETDGLVQRLTASRERFLAVIGSSGSGKSSLVSAGLLPRLNIRGKDWVWLPFTPGEVSDDPFMALAAALVRTFAQQGWKTRALAARLRTEPGALENIAGEAKAAVLVLFIDQFEELFTIVGASHQAPFIDLIASVIQNERLRIVVTLRADFYGHCTQSETLVGLLLEGSYPLGTPGMLALTEMVTRPAKAAGLAFEDGLAERVLKDRGTEPGALALMEFTLSKLYELKAGTQLTHASYEQLGGIAGAIEARAKQAVRSDGAVDEKALEQLFRTVVAVNAEDTVKLTNGAFEISHLKANSCEFSTTNKPFGCPKWHLHHTLP